MNDLYELARGLGENDWLDVAGTSATEVPDGCLLDHFGIALTEIGRGKARARMRVERHHLNQRGIAQAGAIVAFADAIAGWATYTSVPGRFATLSLNTNLLRAARDGDELEAVATVVHPGRTTHVLDVVVDRANDVGDRSKVATFGCTQLVLAGEPQ